MVDIFSHGRMPILAVSRLHLIDPSSIEHKCLLDSLSKLHLTDKNSCNEDCRISVTTIFIHDSLYGVGLTHAVEPFTTNVKVTNAMLQ